MCASFDDQQKWLTALNEAIATEPSLQLAPKPVLTGPSSSNRASELVNPDIDMEGWLMRKGSGIGGVGLKSWTKRYFRLSSLNFNMFKNEKEQKPLSVTSVGNLDNVDYFATKREGNRFDVLSHDDFGSSLTSLYATDAKVAIRWCRRIQKAMDEWEQTKAKLQNKHSDLHHKPTIVPNKGLAERRLSQRLSDTENSGVSKEDVEEDEPGVSDNIDEVLGQLGSLDPEEEEPMEDPPDVDGVDEEQQILRDRQRAETGVETKEMMENNTVRKSSAQDFERRFLEKRTELERAIQAMEEDGSDDESDKMEQQVADGAAESRAFPNFRLLSLVEIFALLEMSDYRENFKKHELSSLDVLDMNPGRLSTLIAAKGPRGRLIRYLQPFVRARVEAETARHMKQLERSLERIGSELANVTTSIAQLNTVFYPPAI
jgi:hypothetical protein